MVAPSNIVWEIDFIFQINVFYEGLLFSAVRTSELVPTFIFLKCKSIFCHLVKCSFAVVQFALFAVLQENRVQKLQTAKTAICK